jgi:hypothetical protein
MSHVLGNKRDGYRVLVMSPERKRTFGSSRRRWEDNTKMDFQDIEWKDMDWVDLR